MSYRSDPADHDAGWAATEVTLTATEGHTLNLSCRWIEYSHAGKGKEAAAFFIVTFDVMVNLGDRDWQALAFKDSRGATHHYIVSDAELIGPLKIRLTKVS